MKNLFNALLGISKTVVVAITVVIVAIILMFGIIFGMCLS